MNSRRVQSSIDKLQKGINDCEVLVSKVVKGKVDKSKSSTLKCDTSTRERSALTYVTPHREKSTVSPPSKLSSRKPICGNRVLCKEVFENNNATVEVTVKAKTSTIDKNRKRLRSNAYLTAAETDGTSKNDQKNVTDLFDLPVPSKVNRKGYPMRKGLSTKAKHLSWDRILKNREGPCKVHHYSKDKKFTSNSNSLQKMPSGVPINSTESIENSYSSSHESVHYRSKSVQCCLLKNIVYDAAKQETNVPTNKSSQTGLNVGNDGSSMFSFYNPVRTLKFLVKELNSKINNYDNENNLQRIVTDMEQALTHISLESNNQEFKENINIPVKDVTSKPISMSFIPIKPVKPTQSNDFIQKIKLPEPYLRDIPQKHVSPSKSSHVRDESQRHLLLEGLETKCAKLESNLIQLEQKYELQRKEKDSLTEQIKSLKEQFELVNSREKDYLTTINYLRSNLQTMNQRVEQQAKSISELSTKNMALKEENKALSNLREREAVLGKHLKESTENEGKIHSELQIMKLEQEKFHILLAAKNSEVQKLKQELRDIQSFVSKQLSNLKSYVFSHGRKKVLHELFGSGKPSSFVLEDSDIESVELLKNGGKGNGKPVCSSPTSSIPSSSGINSSWQKISRISSASEKDLKKSSPEVLVLSPPKIRNMEENDDEIDLAENCKSFPLMKSDNLDVKSFLLESLSDSVLNSTRQISNVTEPKSCQELKDELRDFFDKIKREASKDLGVSLPSPPHHFSDISEPGGMSQWSEVSDGESTPFLSMSNTVIKNRTDEI